MKYDTLADGAVVPPTKPRGFQNAVGAPARPANLAVGSVGGPTSLLDVAPAGQKIGTHPMLPAAPQAPMGNTVTQPHSAVSEGVNKLKGFGKALLGGIAAPAAAVTDGVLNGAATAISYERPDSTRFTGAVMDQTKTAVEQAGLPTGATTLGNAFGWKPAATPAAAPVAPAAAPAAPVEAPTAPQTLAAAPTAPTQAPTAAVAPPRWESPVYQDMRGMDDGTGGGRFAPGTTAGTDQFGVPSFAARMGAAQERQGYRRGFQELQESNKLSLGREGLATQRYGSDNSLYGQVHSSDNSLRGQMAQIGEHGRQFDTTTNNAMEQVRIRGIDDAVKNSGLTGPEAQRYREFITHNNVPGTEKRLHEMSPTEQLKHATEMRQAHTFNEEGFNKRGFDAYGRDVSNELPTTFTERKLGMGDVSHSASVINKYTPWTGLPNITNTYDDKGNLEELGLTGLLAAKMSGRDKVLVGADQHGNERYVKKGSALRAAGLNGRGDNLRTMAILKKNSTGGQ